MKIELSELVNTYSEKLASTGFAITTLPSKLPDSQFIYALKDGAKPMVTLASILDANKHSRRMAKEIENYSKSVRIYTEDPAKSSIRGIPLGVLVQDLQETAESFVARNGDSANFIGVVTRQGFRFVKPTRKQTRKKPFEYIAEVGRTHKADLVIVGWGGWERAIEPPNQRTGREVVSIIVLSPDGTVFASLSRKYKRDSKKIIWGGKENITWAGGRTQALINPEFDTAWREARANAA
jgi:hypothetical protein